MMNLFNKHLCTLGGGGILNCVQCVKNTKKLLHFSQRLPLLFIFSYLPPHWDARYRPKKRLPSFLNKTKKEWKKFMRAYPRFRRNYRGVSRIMLPVLEDFFKIRIEAYQKTRDRDDKKLCKFGQIKHNRGILHTSVCRPTNHCHFFNFSSHQRMVRQSKTPWHAHSTTRYQQRRQPLSLHPGLRWLSREIPMSKVLQTIYSKLKNYFNHPKRRKIYRCSSSTHRCQ